MPRTRSSCFQRIYTIVSLFFSPSQVAEVMSADSWQLDPFLRVTSISVAAYECVASLHRNLASSQTLPSAIFSPFLWSWGYIVPLAGLSLGGFVQNSGASGYVEGTCCYKLLTLFILQVVVRQCRAFRPDTVFSPVRQQRQTGTHFTLVIVISASSCWQSATLGGSTAGFQQKLARFTTWSHRLSKAE